MLSRMVDTGMARQLMTRDIIRQGDEIKRLQRPFCGSQWVKAGTGPVLQVRFYIYFPEYMIVLLTGGETMKDLLLLIGFLVFWVVLQKYILPRLGIST